MKNNIYKIIILLGLALSFNSCQKVTYVVDYSGFYLAQNPHSPFGSSIQLFTNGNAEVRLNGFYYNYSYFTNGNRIHFSDGTIGKMYSSNELVFESTFEYLNPAYYDGNGDGYDDWDYTIPHYIWQTNYFSYWLQ